jgi:AcrR family transcriptional regulator
MPRTRRAQKAEETRQRILRAAAGLFGEVGFAATTIEAIAARADIAVETVYSRFRNKASLLDAILGPAITGRDDAPTLLDRPEIAEIKAASDQRRQVALLAAFSRGVLERTHDIHRILHAAAAVDPGAAALERADQRRRWESQVVYIDMLLANGRLRAGLTREAARDTYAALANPQTFAFFVDQLGWEADRFESWLADALERLLLP